MKVEINTKFDIGQTVFYIKHTTSYEEIPCEHCNGNYREIVNDIEYTCPYCKGGREKKRIDKYRVKSGIITNIRIAVKGIDTITDPITKEQIETNVKYSVTENNTELFYESDGNSTNLYEGELYSTVEEAETVIKKVCVVTHLL